MTNIFENAKSGDEYKDKAGFSWFYVGVNNSQPRSAPFVLASISGSLEYFHKSGIGAKEGYQLTSVPKKRTTPGFWVNFYDNTIGLRIFFSREAALRFKKENSIAFLYYEPREYTEGEDL